MLKEIPVPEMKYSDEKADRRLALKILLVVAVSFFVMGFGCRGAFALQGDPDIAGIADDANVMISGKTYKRIMALFDYVCTDGYLSDRTGIANRKGVCK